MLEEINTYDIPTYAVTYLEYGDSSGIEQDDIDNIDEWLTRELNGFESLVFEWNHENNESFVHTPEFGLACQVIECTIWGHKTED